MADLAHHRRAEAALQAWFEQAAPATATLCRDKAVLREVREHLNATRPELVHDLSALPLEAIRACCSVRATTPALAPLGFEVFFAERQRVDLFDDARPALDFLSARWPIVALSNGNADVNRVGLGGYFKASVSAREFGVGSPMCAFFMRRPRRRVWRARPCCTSATMRTSTAWAR